MKKEKPNWKPNPEKARKEAIEAIMLNDLRRNDIKHIIQKYKKMWQGEALLRTYGVEGIPLNILDALIEEYEKRIK